MARQMNIRWSTERLIRRVLEVLGTLLLVALVVAMIVPLLPGDPAAIAAGEFASPEVVERVREELGLNEPFIKSYAGLVANASTGDLGQSAQLRPGADVTSLVWQAFPTTASLAICALVFAVTLSMIAGLAAAARPRGIVDRAITTVAALVLAVPPFVLGLLLASAFAVSRPWFPALGYASLDEGLWEWARHLVLPAITLGAVSAAELTRQVRGAMVDTFEQDYIRTAIAKGMSKRQVVWKHALKNAATPIVTVAGLQVSRLVGGAVIVERIFAMPGVGSLAFESVVRRDIPLMQGVILIVATFVVLLNLFTDLAVAHLNPSSSSARSIA